MGVAAQTDAGGTLLDGFEGVLDLVQAALRRPRGDVAVVLVPELYARVSMVCIQWTSIPWRAHTVKEGRDKTREVVSAPFVSSTNLFISSISY